MVAIERSLRLHVSSLGRRADEPGVAVWVVHLSHAPTAARAFTFDDLTVHHGSGGDGLGHSGVDVDSFQAESNAVSRSGGI